MSALTDNARRVFDFIFGPPVPLVERGYDAAAGGRRWTGASVTPNLASATLSGSERIRPRAIDAAINAPLGASAADVWTSEAVGCGLRVVPATGR